MELNELQRILDQDKWAESELAGRDVCGEFPYCVCCNKNTPYPCATAYRKHYEKKLYDPFRKRAPKKLTK